METEDNTLGYESDEIDAFIESLPKEAIEAGAEALEETVIGDYVTCLDHHVRIALRTILRACYKARCTEFQLPAWQSLLNQDGRLNKPQ